MMNPHITSVEARLLEASLAHIRTEITRHGDTLAGINDSLHKLIRVEEAQVAIKERLQEGSKKLTEHEIRIEAIEKMLPSLSETRRWVIWGILAGVGMIGASLVKLVLFS